MWSSHSQHHHTNKGPSVKKRTSAAHQVNQLPLVFQVNHTTSKTTVNPANTSVYHHKISYSVTVQALFEMNLMLNVYFCAQKLMGSQLILLHKVKSKN